MMITVKLLVVEIVYYNNVIKSNTTDFSSNDTRRASFVVPIPTDADTVLATKLIKEVLEADGWVIDDSMHDIEGSSWGYFARKEGYDFYLRFFSLVDPDEDLGAFVFHLYPNSFDCTGGLIF